MNNGRAQKCFNVHFGLKCVVVIASVLQVLALVPFMLAQYTRTISYLILIHDFVLQAEALSNMV